MLKLQFDPNQQYQLDAIESIARLFEGLPRQEHAGLLQAEIVPNLPPYTTLAEEWLYDNLREIQQSAGIETPLIGSLAVDDGMVLEGVGYESWRYPSFTVEMETGTGKTYVYLRTVHELRRRYGFGKFIVVVPSIAIYEGVIKNFQITRDHFRALYGNETVNLVAYDGARLSQLRSFAASTFVEILVMTLDSFNKVSNVIFKPSEKLPGERLPIQYIQETRPILILDEPQNMESEKAKSALRTLHPLFALRYSATHRTSPNLVYRLTPFDAYRLNLVKKIQVFGVTERENFNQPYLSLRSVEVGRRIAARLRTYVMEKGRLREGDVVLHDKDDLFEKTGREEHRGGYRVSEINAAAHFVEFENGVRLHTEETIGPSRPAIFRIQIRETIRQHMEMQEKLEGQGIKVLSLFFIDRVANYTAPNGLIRRIFDEVFDQLKYGYSFFQDRSAAAVRSAYFAEKRDKSGQATAIDTNSSNQGEREAERAAFELIMRDKERLLSFEEPVSFVFAHSALKEGWDNPNVFQICTLNQTVSEVKKRQEIGRGLRLAVNKEGARVFADDVNVLTVVANESYESYARTLQSEYVEDGVAAPPPPTKAGRATVHRNDDIFRSDKAFQAFWIKLQKHVTYELSLDTDALVQACVERINNRPLPTATIVVEKGDFVVVDYTIELSSVAGETCKLAIVKLDTRSNEETRKITCNKSEELEKTLNDPRLRGYKIVEIVAAGDTSRIVFGNGQTLYVGQKLRFQSESGQTPRERAALAPAEKYPLTFNLIDRAARETGLTRPTLVRIFQSLNERRKAAIFDNPEGFAGLFITEISNALADHIAERIQFHIAPADKGWGYDLDDLFPAKKEFPQKELIPGSAASLYDHVQIDSDIEKGFVEQRLNLDGDVVFYFKFPPRFKFDFPRVIGNYNPDWGIARYAPDDHGDRVVVELIRETKGQLNPNKLQFAHETRKVKCAKKLFAALGVDYRIVTDKVADWWERGEEQQSLSL
jgi:type III restriction enzyme